MNVRRETCSNLLPLFTIHYSPFTIHYSQFTIHHSLFTIHHSLLSQQLIIYTDGAARGNPGPGGYGAVLIWGNARKELSGGFRRTTNNRMELMAVIAALQSLKREGLDVTIFSDSSYVVNAIEKGWLRNWIRTG